MVVIANAIVDPRTVMVEALNAPVADAAVARAVSPDHFTVGTQQHWVKYLHHLHECDALGTLEIARVFKEQPSMEEQSEAKYCDLRVD